MPTSTPGYKTGQQLFKLTDKSGTYFLERKLERKGKNIYQAHTRVYVVENGQKKELERASTTSVFGYLGKKVPVLRPKSSKFEVWFDKRSYKVEMNVNVKRRSMNVRMESPESQWKGDRLIAFPKGTGVFCFFNNVMECVGVTGFVNKAIKKGAGQMKFHVIWEGFPYFQEQYLNISQRLFAPARLNYDGTNKKGEHRFSLDVAGQSIFYLLDKSKNLSRWYWVAQGVSVVKAM